MVWRPCHTTRLAHPTACRDTAPLFPEPDVSAWQESAEAAKADVQVFRYPNTGHYFSDPALPDYNATAAAQLWSRSLAFLT
ncbi:hypothetical protein X739_30675 [Mesorhizobium sp. LNHC220B00]|nr:dienelactone hydrolase family protein [Mesorhizobium sp. LNHC220B00]ESY79165.1 hypothetical protein X739_30675 [Mesorhizobium sp. LNHC220B00]